MVPDASCFSILFPTGTSLLFDGQVFRVQPMPPVALRGHVAAVAVGDAGDVLDLGDARDAVSLEVLELLRVVGEQAEGLAAEEVLEQ